MGLYRWLVKVSWLGKLVSFLYSGSLWSSLLWHFLAVCGFVQVACQGFLVREACVGVLVGGAVFLLSGVQ